eukprot:g4250.t1
MASKGLVVGALALLLCVGSLAKEEHQAALRAQSAEAPHIDPPGEGEVVLPDNTVVHTFTAKTLNVGNLHIENDEVMSGSSGIKLPETRVQSLEVSGGGVIKGYTQLGTGAPSIRMAVLEAKLPVDAASVPPAVPIRDAENRMVTTSRVLSVEVVLLREGRIIPNWSAREGIPYVTWWVDDAGFHVQFVQPEDLEKSKSYFDNLKKFGGQVRATVLFTPASNA